jgi:hypothetical protein
MTPPGFGWAMIGSYVLGVLGMWLVLRWQGLDGSDLKRRRSRDKELP